MPTFVTSPVLLPDLPAIAIVSRAAFKDSPHTMSYWMFPQDNEEATYKWLLRSITSRFNNDPACYLIKCVDTISDEIVAFALWQTPHPKETKEEKAIERQEENAKMDGGDSEELPEGMNVPLMHDFDEATQKMRAKYVNVESDYVLRAIATLPEYQGKGCGSLLLRSGLETIDIEGANTFLEATPQGRPLYEKFGWKFVDEMVFDLGKYGCAGVQKTTCMMRAAKK